MCLQLSIHMPCWQKVINKNGFHNWASRSWSLLFVHFFPQTPVWTNISTKSTWTVWGLLVVVIVFAKSSSSECLCFFLPSGWISKAVSTSCWPLKWAERSSPQNESAGEVDGLQFAFSQAARAMFMRAIPQKGALSGVSPTPRSPPESSSWIQTCWAHERSIRPTIQMHMKFDRDVQT